MLHFEKEKKDLTITFTHAMQSAHNDDIGMNSTAQCLRCALLLSSCEFEYVNICNFIELLQMPYLKNVAFLF